MSYFLDQPLAYFRLRSLLEPFSLQSIHLLEFCYFHVPPHLHNYWIKVIEMYFAHSAGLIAFWWELDSRLIFLQSDMLRNFPW